MNTLRGLTSAVALPCASSAALAQNSNMMGGWSNGFMGGYGSPWLAVVLLVLIIGVAVWIIKRK